MNKYTVSIANHNDVNYFFNVRENGKYLGQVKCEVRRGTIIYFEHLSRHLKNLNHSQKEIINALIEQALS